MAKPKIFVSHSTLDSAFASKLVNDLNAAEAQAWMDVNDLGAGNFQENISQALSDCEWFVLVLTRNALASDWVRQEVDAANRLKHQKRIKELIFIKAADVEHSALPALWGVFNIFDATADYDAALTKTLNAIGLSYIEKDLSSATSIAKKGASQILTEATFLTNELIADRYELDEPIGRGGMATIHKAIDLRMGREVAVKILREVYSSDPESVTRFQRGARAASALPYSNIVQVFDYGQSGDTYYIVMELINGADLRRYLKREGVLTPERAVEIAHDVALGLGAAHRRGIVHCNVKPGDILLNDDGLVKLTDFGHCSFQSNDDLKRNALASITLAAVQYYAPEQARGEIVTPAADIYALGIVLYEMLTGKTPFDGDTPVALAMKHIQDIPEPPSHLNPVIPHMLERIILRCIEKDPRVRYPNGDALAYALDQYARRSAKG